MTIDEIHVGSVIRGPLLPEPVEVIAVVSLGDCYRQILAADVSDDGPRAGAKSSLS